MAASRNQYASPPTASPIVQMAAPSAFAPVVDELRRIADALNRLAANHDDGDADALSPADETLFQALRKWRADEARKLGMPPYIVATDRVLRAVAQARPATVEELRKIPGFGPAKTAKYGDALVAAVAST